MDFYLFIRRAVGRGTNMMSSLSTIVNGEGVQKSSSDTLALLPNTCPDT